MIEGSRWRRGATCFCIVVATSALKVAGIDRAVRRRVSWRRGSLPLASAVLSRQHDNSLRVDHSGRPACMDRSSFPTSFACGVCGGHSCALHQVAFLPFVRSVPFFSAPTVLTVAGQQQNDQHPEEVAGQLFLEGKKQRVVNIVTVAWLATAGLRGGQILEASSSTCSASHTLLPSASAAPQVSSQCEGVGITEGVQASQSALLHGPVHFLRCGSIHVKL